MLSCLAWLVPEKKSTCTRQQLCQKTMYVCGKDCTYLEVDLNLLYKTMKTPIISMWNGTMTQSNLLHMHTVKQVAHLY